MRTRVVTALGNLVRTRHKQAHSLGAGNARNNFAAIFCTLNHKLPACPGAGNARQFFGGRFLCKVESQTQYTSQENARDFFACIVLGLEGTMQMDETIEPTKWPERGEKIKSRGLACQIECARRFLYGRG